MSSSTITQIFGSSITDAFTEQNVKSLTFFSCCLMNHFSFLFPLSRSSLSLRVYVDPPLSIISSSQLARHAFRRRDPRRSADGSAAETRFGCASHTSSSLWVGVGLGGCSHRRSQTILDFSLYFSMTDMSFSHPLKTHREIRILDMFIVFFHGKNSKI